MSTPRIERERAEVAAEAVKHLQDDWTITVCDRCLCVCCWHGEFMCESAKYAGTKEITVGVARGLNRESPTWWTRDEQIMQRLLNADVYA